MLPASTCRAWHRVGRPFGLASARGRRKGRPPACDCLCPRRRVFAEYRNADALRKLKLVRLSVAQSNQLFAELSNWNHILKDISTDQLDQIDDPANDPADADAALKDALGGGHD